MITTTRLVWKQHRFELFTVLAVLAVLTGLILDAWWRMKSQQPSSDCLAYWIENAANGPGCAMASWMDARENGGGNLVGYTAYLPMIGGAILGSLLVAREIEHRTAQLAWSLSPSRNRWLVERVIPLFVPFVVALVALAVASELVVGAKGPDVDPRASFEDYGGRGLPLVMRAVAVFAVALVAGALIGRQIPALLGGAVALFLIQSLMGLAFPFGLEGEWAADELQINYGWGRPDIFLEYGFVLPDGRYATWDEAKRLAPEGVSPGEWVYSSFPQVSRVLRGTDLFGAEAREAAVLGLVAVASFVTALVVISRRRPY